MGEEGTGAALGVPAAASVSESQEQPATASSGAGCGGRGGWLAAGRTEGTVTGARCWVSRASSTSGAHACSAVHALDRR